LYLDYIMHDVGRKIEVDCAYLHFQECGSPEGSELLFLHGGAGTLEDWHSIIDQFGDYRCILLDSRGHGASTLGARPLDYPRLADDAEAIIAECNLSAPTIIGHSDGGIAGIIVAARKNVHVAGLVTIGAHAEPPRADILRDVFMQLTAKKWQARFPDTVTLYEQLNPEPDFYRLFEALVNMWCNTAEGNYPAELATNVACPALIMGGDRDHLVSREETYSLARRIGNADLGIIPFGSHVPHWDHPERVTPYIREFLQ
jgi:valacyclovir hydrolase